ncbi:MAG: hypothetical protein LBI33_07465 [Propionibacteriaceae bacterium]|jgi:hypothetical protein|nr:hypothetical protein [Propionibacteriaceae bacterium]
MTETPLAALQEPLAPVPAPADPVVPLQPPAATLSTLRPPPEIATLAPLEVIAPARYPASERTGEPRRPATLLAAIGFCWASVATAIGGYAGWWWQAAHIPTFWSSARLLTWTTPDPVSALAIVMVITISLIFLLMVAAAGTVAYNAWAGARWIRVGGVVCLAVTGLSFLVSWYAAAAMIPLVIGVILLWLPPAKRFLAAMAAAKTSPDILVPTSGITYGPQSRWGSPARGGGVPS